MYFLIPLLVLEVLSAEGFLKSPEKSSTFNNYGDVGEPLFLTPYIESGKVEEARKLARVTLPGHADIESYAGFITINKEYDTNHFVWYFPAEKVSMLTKKHITIVWLQGGPGATSLFGLFDEIGPVYVENNTILRRKPFEYWSQIFNVIYIDNPAGTGFSFTRDQRGLVTNQTQIGERLYDTLTQVYQLFSELTDHDLVISGESYGGKHAPSLAYMIHKNNPTAATRGEPHLPLKGITVGNGFSDPINQLDHAEYLYQLGLIGADIRDEVNSQADEIRHLIKEGQSEAAMKRWNLMLRTAQFYMFQVSLYDYTLITPDTSLKCSFCEIINSNQMRKAIHVGNQTFQNINYEVYKKLGGDFMYSVTPWISELLEHYKMWFYNGQYDIIVAYPLTENFLRKLEWSGQDEYQTAMRIPLYYAGFNETTVMGYEKSAGNLRESLIRGGGHMVPGERSEWVMLLLESWCTKL